MSPLVRTGFVVDVDDEGGAAVVLRLHGELDMATADQLRAALALAAADADAAVIVLDLAELRFMDSTGLSVILAGWRQADSRGRSLRLRHPTRLVRKLLRVTGFDQVFHIEERSAEAG